MPRFQDHPSQKIRVTASKREALSGGKAQAGLRSRRIPNCSAEVVLGGLRANQIGITARFVPIAIIADSTTMCYVQLLGDGQANGLMGCLRVLTIIAIAVLMAFATSAREAPYEYQNPGPVDPEIDRLQAEAAKLIAANKYDAAADLIEQAYRLSRDVRGSDDLKTLDVLGRLAFYHTYYTGKAAVAEPIARVVYAARQRLLGPEHSMTLLAGTTLAGALFQEGKFDEEEELNRYFYQVYARLRGAEDAATLSVEMNLAASYAARGRYLEAEVLLRKIYETRRRVDDRGSLQVFNTLITLENLAEVIGEQGRFSEAARLYAQSREGLRKSGLSPISVTYAQFLLARMFERAGSYEEAEKVYAEAIVDGIMFLGQDGVMVLEMRTWHDRTMLKQHRYGEMEPRLRQQYETDKAVLGPDHPTTLYALASLAIAIDEQGHHDQAVQLSEEVRRRTAAIYGATSPWTLEVQTDIARSYERMGRLQDAERMLASTVADYRATLGALQPEAIVAAARLGILRGRKLGNPARGYSDLKAAGDAAWHRAQYEIEPYQPQDRTQLGAEKQMSRQILSSARWIFDGQLDVGWALAHAP